MYNRRFRVGISFEQQKDLTDVPASSSRTSCRFLVVGKGGGNEQQKSVKSLLQTLHLELHSNWKSEKGSLMKLVLEFPSDEYNLFWYIFGNYVAVFM